MPEFQLADLETLFAVYVTTDAPVKALEDLVESSADSWLSKDQVTSPYLLSIIRTKADPALESSRIQSLPFPSGPHPPISPSPNHDFISANLFDLATFNISTFPEGNIISNDYFLVFDSRSLLDRTVILVKIPRQAEFDENKELVETERKFHRREEYPIDKNGWVDRETGDWIGVEELKAVRVRFEDANLVNMLDDGHEDIGTLAEKTFGTDGAFVEGATYPEEE